MSYETTVELDGKTYKLAAIRTGQMQKQQQARRKSGDAPDPMLQNIELVSFCLSNGQPEYPEQNTVEAVGELPWPAFKVLLDSASEVSGFTAVSTDESGKTQAAPAITTGPGSTVA